MPVWNTICLLPNQIIGNNQNRKEMALIALSIIGGVAIFSVLFVILADKKRGSSNI